MFIRKKRYRSSRTSVIVVEKISGKMREITTIGIGNVYGISFSISSLCEVELLAYFLKVFLANSEGTSQMLLTIHDINLLNEDFIRRDTIWFTDKDELGETKIVRLSNLGLHKNLSPYNAYKQGKLVKLPFLGSQYINLNNQ